nr:hypothetical protein BgiMline_022341 [Biomphalaria glabrata]
MYQTWRKEKCVSDVEKREMCIRRGEKRNVYQTWRKNKRNVLDDRQEKGVSDVEKREMCIRRGEKRKMYQA